MKLLLNSHTAYWWTAGDGRLSTRAKEVILDDANVASSQCSFDLRA